MKAAVYDRNGPPDVFRYEDVPDPQLHARGVIVEVAAVSIEGGDVRAEQVWCRAGQREHRRDHLVNTALRDLPSVDLDPGWTGEAGDGSALL